MSGGDYPELSVSEADGHICPCCVSDDYRCLYLKLRVTFALVVSGGDYPSLSVSEADGHICPCCVRWLGGDYPALSVSEADGHICPCCVRW